MQYVQVSSSREWKDLLLLCDLLWIIYIIRNGRVHSQHPKDRRSCLLDAILNATLLAAQKYADLLGKVCLQGYMQYPP